MGSIDMRVSDDLVKPIIEAKIQAAIATALGGEKELIGIMLDRILSLKVSHEGKVSNYDSENKFTFIEVLCKKAIEAAARTAIQDWVTNNQSTIQKGMEIQLRKQSGAMTKAFVDGLMESIKSSWTFKVQVGLQESK